MTFNLHVEEERRIVTEPVSPTQIAHLVFRTPNFNAMREFYKIFLNAVPAFENERICFLRYDEEHHRIALVNTPTLTLAPKKSAGLAHYAFTYQSLGEVLGTYQRLKQFDIHPCWCINHGFTTSIYYNDPDGHMVETQFDNMGSDDADAFMHTEYFIKNPVGVDFDPELLIKRYQAGDPLEELLQQGAAPFTDDKEPVRPDGVADYDYRGKLL